MSTILHELHAYKLIRTPSVVLQANQDCAAHCIERGGGGGVSVVIGMLLLRDSSLLLKFCLPPPVASIFPICFPIRISNNTADSCNGLLFNSIVSEFQSHRSDLLRPRRRNLGSFNVRTHMRTRQQARLVLIMASLAICVCCASDREFMS